MLPVLKIGTFSLPSYGLCMATGIILSFMVAFIRLKSRKGDFDTLLLVAAIALAIGLCFAKLSYYIFSYGIGRLFSEIFSGDFSGFTASGLVYYGGLVGGIAGGSIAIYAFKLSFDDYANAIIPCIPLGHAVGRIGCLLAGCCYGKKYDGPFAVHSFLANPNEMYFPIQAVECVINLFLFAALLLITRKPRKGVFLLGIYCLLYANARFILEFYRGDLIRGAYLGLSTSQWISILLILVGVAFLIWDQKGYHLPEKMFRSNKEKKYDN